MDTPNKDTKIIVISNVKGGCGKSTVALNLAGAMASRGLKTLLVDTDTQQTAQSVASAAGESTPFPTQVIGMSGHQGKIHNEIKKFFGQYDFILIDCPAGISPIPHSAMLVADLVLIPAVPSPHDLWACSGEKQLIENARIVNDTLKSLLVLSQVQKGHAITRDVTKVIQDPDFGLQCAVSTIRQATAYRVASASGTTVYGLKQTHEQQDDINRLLDECIAYLKGEPTYTEWCQKTISDMVTNKYMRKNKRKPKTHRKQSINKLNHQHGGA